MVSVKSLNSMKNVLRPAVVALACLSLLAACEDDAGPGDGGTDTFGADTDKDTTPPQDTNTGGPNRAPELEGVGDRIVAVGETLRISLAAQDADGDTLTFSVFGALPPGARFDKTTNTFEWTPEEAGKTHFLTFVVSDGEEFDRETVRIEVVSESQKNPPTFEQVGDQAVTANLNFSLKLSATDPDGESLTYGHQGQLPDGASLDPTTGVFMWRPPAALAGETVRVTFTVSDGSLEDTMAVRFIVSDGQTGGPAPPIFDDIQPQTATVGQTLTINIDATDPNGDPLTYSIESGAPDGSQLVGQTFTYTPLPSAAGQAFQVVFNVTDGTFNAVTQVQISVDGGVQACGGDSYEPNDTAADAKTITVGTPVDALICGATSALDTDNFSIELTAGQAVEFQVTFNSDAGDLDVQLFNAAGIQVAGSETSAATEQFTYTPDASGTYQLSVVGLTFDPNGIAYQLTTNATTVVGCNEDNFEPNSTPAQSQALPAPGTALQLCAGDEDWFDVTASCGSAVTVTMTILTPDADLDVRLYAPSSDEPIGEGGLGFESIEQITVGALEESGVYQLRVTGYPQATAEGAYNLDFVPSPGCTESAIGGDSTGNATGLPGTSGTQSNAVLCCRDDWFTVNAAAGDTITILAEGQTANDLVGAAIFAADGTTQLASETPTGGGVIVSTVAQGASTFYVKVFGGAGADYNIEWDVSAGQGGGGCTELSCPLYNVCNTATGECVDDFCASGLSSDCPPGNECFNGYCVNPCSSDANCRGNLDYTCKSFPEGQFCGLQGGGWVGDSCTDHEGCRGAQVCILQDLGGYCAEANCGNLVSCSETNASCGDIGGVSACGQGCFADAECRPNEGIICEAGLCVPE